MKHRFYYMDLLNIMATFAVVMLHGSNFSFSNQGGLHWDISVVIQVLFIFAVPIFFMLSGANIIDYRNRENTKTFFKKRLHRVMIPFIFWTVVWFVYNNVEYWHYSWKNWQTYSILFDGILHDNIQPIFWFFYIIIGFYISVPLLSKIVTTNQKQLVQYLLLINLVFGGLGSYYFQLRNQPDAAFSNGISVGVAGSIGLFVLGWYLKNFPLKKEYRKILYLLGVLSLFVMVALTFILSHYRGSYQRQVYSIWGIFGILWSASVFVFIQNLFMRWTPTEKVQNLLKGWSSASLGVYVIHYFFIDLAEVRYHLHSKSLIHMFILPVVVWLTTLLIVKILQKIPYLRRTV